MAKQRGVVQLSGRVDNLCYYQQKRVRGGLVRRINLAMSERLKSDPVFKRTREANSIFGMCSMAAGTLIECFGLGTREMLVPDIQSRLTKTFLEIFKSQENHNFGDNFDYGIPMGIRICNAFNSFSRNRSNPLVSFFPNVVYSSEQTADTMVTLPDNLLQSYCVERGLRGIRFRIYRTFYADTPNFNTQSQKYIKGFYARGRYEDVPDWTIGDGDLTFSVHGSPPLGPPDYVLVFGIGLRSNGLSGVTRDALNGFYVLIVNDS